MGGPLKGIRIIEFAGIGPGPFAAMMLADHGADVIRIDRPTTSSSGDQIPEFGPLDVLARSRRSVALDLKNKDAVAAARRLCAQADGLIEGNRPGVMERLGLGPDKLLADNPRLVYGRMTGWGQTGPLAARAGHDINYIALSGALYAMGRRGDKPTPPLNLVGDYGGGAMMLAFAMLAALYHARATGQGQVIDAAMAEGSALLMGTIQTLREVGMWRDERGANLLDSGAHFYDTYECADGNYIAIGAIEPQFYRALLDALGLANDPEFSDRGAQMNPQRWPALSQRLTIEFARRTRDEWCALLEDSDVCFAPVLSLAEAPDHPQNKARQSYVEVGDMIQPAPAPRYSNTVLDTPRAARPSGADTISVLREFGIEEDELDGLRCSGAIS